MRWVKRILLWIHGVAIRAPFLVLTMCVIVGLILLGGYLSLDQKDAHPPPSSHREAKEPATKKQQSSPEIYEEQMEARNVIDRFIRIYLSYEARDTAGKWADLEPYIARRLKKEWQGIAEEQAEVENTKVTNVELFHENEEEGTFRWDDRGYWDVYVETQTTFYDGYRDKVWNRYQVITTKEQGRWVVEEVIPDGEVSF